MRKAGRPAFPWQFAKPPVYDGLPQPPGRTPHATMTSPLILKLAQRDQLSDEERRLLEEAPSTVVEYEAGQDMVCEGDEPAHSSLLLEGWAMRNKTLKNGARQITALHIMGDFVDLHAFLLKPMDHTVTALTRCRVALVPHETLKDITERHPHLTRVLWLNTLIDGAVHREWLLAMGRLSAAGHLAHLLCELFLRLRGVGLTEGQGFPFPLTQAVLADVLGLSAVHVNRTVQELRREGLVTWTNGAVTINDWERLAARAEFDPTYLNITLHPR